MVGRLVESTAKETGEEPAALTATPTEAGVPEPFV